MASLIGELTETLENMSSVCDTLMELALKKTPVIVKGDLESLAAITDDEQLNADKLVHLDHKRGEVMQEIAGVLNTDVKLVTLAELIRILEKKPVEQQKLAAAHDRLKRSITEMKLVNDRNRQLIETALEMTEFELNMIQAMKSAPETANYTKGACNDGSIMGSVQGRFDAKQ